MCLPRSSAAASASVRALMQNKRYSAKVFCDYKRPRIRILTGNRPAAAQKKAANANLVPTFTSSRLGSTSNRLPGLPQKHKHIVILPCLSTSLAVAAMAFLHPTPTSISSAHSSLRQHRSLDTTGAVKHPWIPFSLPPLWTLVHTSHDTTTIIMSAKVSISP
jgi:hypothetical protein